MSMQLYTAAIARRPYGTLFGGDRKAIPVLVLLLALCGCSEYTATADRPAAWATPVQVEGVSHLFKLTDTLYRSDQPTAAGMQNLKKLGIKTVINLRTFHSDRDEIGSTVLRQEHIYMKSWHPEREDAVRFLRLVQDPANAPILVHCQHGADRTGAMCALYRVVVQGWSKQEAIREMREGGFGFHLIWNNLAIWIDECDVERFKKDLEPKQVAAPSARLDSRRDGPTKQRRR
jgi:protein tyrosine phosphatase (PTP) superfamily phosphohydrolase (DUF442 family)